MKIWEDAKAWYRGERRVASSNVRGRVYESTGQPGMQAAKTKLFATMSARVFRAADESWYKVNLTSGEERKE